MESELLTLIGIVIGIVSIFFTLGWKLRGFTEGLKKLHSSVERLTREITELHYSEESEKPRKRQSEKPRKRQSEKPRKRQSE